MGFLFETTKDGKGILCKESVQIVPELRFLTMEEMEFVILACDYYSPYAQFPDDDRFTKAKRHVFKDQNCAPWKEKRIFRAMEAYMSLQFDQRRELKRLYEHKIENLKRDLIIAKTHAEIKNILDAINNLKKQARELEEEIISSNDMKNIEGGEELSLIETMQKNQRLFKDLYPPKFPWKPFLKQLQED